MISNENTLKRKNTKFKKCGCEWLESFKTNDKIKNHIRNHFPCKKHLSTDSFLTKKDGSISGYFWYVFGYLSKRGKILLKIT